MIIPFFSLSWVVLLIHTVLSDEQGEKEEEVGMTKHIIFLNRNTYPKQKQAKFSYMGMPRRSKFNLTMLISNELKFKCSSIPYFIVPFLNFCYT